MRTFSQHLSLDRVHVSFDSVVRSIVGCDLC